MAPSVQRSTVHHQRPSSELSARERSASGRPPSRQAAPTSAAKRSPRCIEAAELVEAGAGGRQQHDVGAPAARAAAKAAGTAASSVPTIVDAARRGGERRGQGRRIAADQQRARDAREERRQRLDAALPWPSRRRSTPAGRSRPSARAAASALVALLSLMKVDRRRSRRPAAGDAAGRDSCAARRRSSARDTPRDARHAAAAAAFCALCAPGRAARPDRRSRRRVAEHASVAQTSAG